MNRQPLDLSKLLVPDAKAAEVEPAPAVTRPHCKKHPNFYDSGCPKCADEAACIDGPRVEVVSEGPPRRSLAEILRNPPRLHLAATHTESEYREAVGLLCEMLGAGRNEDHASKAVHVKAHAWLVEKGHLRG